jgi:hypothetical protein
MAWTLSNNTYFKTIKDDARDRIQAEVGDASSGQFRPHVKLKRWDGEVWLSVEFPSVLSGATRTVDQATETITWTRGDYVLKWYPHPDLVAHPDGALEFEIILGKKPPTNKLTLNFDASGLQAFYQPPLTEEGPWPEGATVTETTVTDAEGRVIAHRPPEIVGSYAVYFRNPPRNVVGGKLYGTGKAFHIERPFLRDAAGHTSWASMAIDGQAKTLIITADQAYLDSAVYPVAIDPTIGYTTILGSESYNTANNIIADILTNTDAQTVDSITLYTKTNAGSNFKGLIVLASNLNASLVGVGGAVLADATYAWKTSTFSTPPSLAAATSYWFGVVIEKSNLYYKYDTTAAANEFAIDSTNSYATPAPPGTASYFTRRISIYATYTEGGGSTALTIAEASHSHAADNIALTQHNALAVAETRHTHAADAPTLTYHVAHYTLTIAEALHSHTADNAALVQHNKLTVADAAHAHAADGAALTQHNKLAVQESRHLHEADGAVLVQHNKLVIADATHSHAADALALVQHNVLAPADTRHLHTADGPVLSLATTLVIADTRHTHAADGLALVQHNALAIQETRHTHAADNPSLVLTYALIIASCLHALTSDGAGLVYNLDIQETRHAHNADLVLLIGGIPVSHGDGGFLLLHMVTRRHHRRGF